MNNMQGKFPSTRLRRNRMKEFSRRLVAENTLSVNDLILPLFVCEGNKVDDPINSMPGVSRYSIDKLLNEVEKAVKLNIPAIAIFPQIESGLKNSEGSLAVDENNLVCRSIKSIKKNFPNIVLMGHSCGAFLSIYLTAHFPEKIKASIVTNPACYGCLLYTSPSPRDRG